MRINKILHLVVLLFIGAAVTAQCVTNVNFNTWSVAENPAQGSWTVQGGGSFVHQNVNGSPTFYISPFDLMNVHISGEFRSTDHDDDWMGFVWSFKNPINAPATNVKGWLFDWKQEDQDNSPGGMAVNYLDGSLAGTPGAQFKDHISTPGFIVTQNHFGGRGWNRGTWHNFDLYLTYTRAIIFVDGVQEFDISDCFEPGRFGFYNLSQPDCDYRNFQYELFIDFELSKKKICVGDTAILQFVTDCVDTLTQYASVTWDFGDGTQVVNTSPNLGNVNMPHVYSTPGIYTAKLTVVDVAGCVDDATNTIEVRDSIKLNPVVVEPLCNGAANGSITPNATGGYGDYNHYWNGGGATKNLTYVGAAAGTYNLSVTDGICSQTGTFTLDQPTALSASTSHTNASCATSNGTASITISGGTPGYQNVSWAGIAATNSGGVWTTTGLWAANHVADFKDANGCSALLQYTENVIELPCGISSNITKTNITCFGGANGSATLTVLLNGSPAPGTISWSNGQTGPTLLNVPAGTYTYTYTQPGVPANNFTGNVTITQPGAAMAASMTTIGISCAGLSDGVALASVISGGTLPYTYTWSGGHPNSPSVTGLSTGPVSVSITDANGCTATASGTIGNAPPILINITVMDDSCYFSKKGSAVAHVSGGSFPYTYVWNNLVADTSNLHISEGAYTITVTDVKGCTATSSATVNGPVLLTKTKVVQHINCTGDSTGSITLTASGGTPGAGGYIYTWSPNVTATGSATNLAAGPYLYTVSDANGCRTVGSDTLLEPATALSVTSIHTDVTCFNANNGSITVTIAGGTGPYNYQGNLIPSAGTYPLSNLPPGIYGGVLTDSLGCTITLSDTILSPGPQSLTLTSTDNTCFGGTAGTADADFVNATGPVVYDWNPGGALPGSRTGLVAGTYDVTATDTNGCSFTGSTTIAEPPVQTMPVTAVDAPCFGANGNATANPVGGAAPFTYVWSITTAGSGQTITPPAGNYTVTASDAASCAQTGTFVINEPPALVMTATATDATCFGGNGSITANPSGSGPFTFAWSGGIGAGPQTITPPAGTYTVTASDAQSCGQTAAAIVNEPPQIMVAEQHTDVACNGASTGSITLTVQTAGTFTYTWTPNVSSTETASNLAMGDYIYTVTDANNCTVSGTITLTAPPALGITVVGMTPALCFGDNTGTITVASTGGVATHSYSATRDGVNYINSASGQFTGLSSYNYTLMVTDANQCSASVDQLVGSPAEIVNSVAVKDVTCYRKGDGEIINTTSGGSGPGGYTYSIRPGVLSNNNIFAGLSGGVYIVTVADGNNCITTDTAEVIEPDSFHIRLVPEAATVDMGESIQLLAVANQPGNVTYKWEPEDGLSCSDCENPVFSGNNTMTYNITATSEAGCKGSSEVKVTVIPHYDVFMPNIFTPNSDGANDRWQIFGKMNAVKQVNVKIFNRTGEMVFESNDINMGWDGTYKGAPAPAGVYVYTAKFVWADNHSDNKYHGTITLLR